MAAERPEVDIVVDGMELKDPYNNQSFIQNLWKQRGLWESRDGFGTLVELNGQLNAIQTKSETDKNTELTYGLEKHLGSYAFETSFGHQQIISIFYARGNTGNEYTDQADKVYLYVACIYDTTTNNYWFETFYKHTEELTEVQQLSPYYHGYYETRNYQTNYSQTKLAKPLYFFFREYLGKVYFGNGLGMYIYNPVAIIDNRYKQINTINSRNEVNDWLSNHYSETSIITPLTFTDGIFAVDEAYTYVTNNELTSIVDVDAFEGRLIYASGRTIYFSDVGQANAVIGDNSFTFWEMGSDITAICQLNGSIIVWSNSQTFLYQPSQGTILSAGRSIRIHDEVGCLSPALVLFRENKVYWSDDKGFYGTDNGMNVDEVSLPIKKFWIDETVNPIIHYFTNNGFAAPLTDSPDFIYRASSNFEGAHLDYDQKTGQIFLVYPKLNLAWIYNNGWYLWSFTSIVDSTTVTEGEPPVTTTTYNVAGNTQISEPWFISNQDKTFIVGGKKENSMYLTEYNGESFVETQLAKYSSFRIFEWKRGGAQDGSTYDYIEGRRFAGFYRYLHEKNPTIYQDTMDIYFEPIEPYGGYVSAESTQADVYYQDSSTYLLPIRVTPNSVLYSTNAPNAYSLSFRIDKDRYRPITWTGATDDSIVFILPTERCGDYAGYSPGAGVVGSYVRYNSSTGIVEIEWDSALIPANTISWGYMNLSEGNKNDLIYIPVRKINRNQALAGVKNPTTNIIVEAITYSWTVDNEGTSVVVDDGDIYDWNPGWFQYPTESERTQPVDWCFKSSQIGMEDAVQIKARGSYALISSTGFGSQIKPWLWGVWNTVAGSDYKDYVSQNIDFVGQEPIKADLEDIAFKSSVRNRWYDNAFSQLQKRYFNSGALWGDATNPTTGNFYVDTPEVDTIATSDSVRGESVSYTFFGFLQDKANKIFIRNIKVALQKVAGRRRRGR